MKMKEYRLFKTPKKTAKENGLIFYVDNFNNKNIFDFSLLESMDIPDEEKEVIKDQAKEYISVAFRESFYMKEIDQFHTCNGIALYRVRKIFSEHTGKLLYRIFELSGIKHYSGMRNSVYDEYYNSTEYIAGSGAYYEPIDIEI